MEYMSALQNDFDELKPSLFGTAITILDDILLKLQNFFRSNSSPLSYHHPSATCLLSLRIGILGIYWVPLTRSMNCTRSSRWLWNAITSAHLAARLRRTFMDSNVNASCGLKMERFSVPNLVHLRRYARRCS